MRKTFAVLLSSVMLVSGVAVTGATPAAAAGAASSAIAAKDLTRASGTAVTEVRDRRRWRRGRGYSRRYYRGPRRHYSRRYYHRRRSNGGAAAAAGIIGLATGAIVGSALANRGGGSDWHAYCASKYRSYDPRSGTYLGYDGRRHACR